ncbi:ADP-forming succinate--CoA ligase subunit beta [bacterium]|nr:ADP-forming succinate--CoA ligase subunit beta [bacterium]|tara:strand:+ start:4273 stop:5409 length:1137 start_codon:yes stop_codon:yes gene_type:complete
MDFKEYQGKKVLSERFENVALGLVTSNVHDAISYASEVGFPVVIKAQVLIGGRGKAGGVKLAFNKEEAESISSAILGMDIKGHKVEEILVAKAVDIKEEWYMSITFDRANRSMTLIFSVEGGVDIEQVAHDSPEKVLKMPINPLKALEISELEKKLLESGLNKSYVDEVVKIIISSYGMVVDKDLTLLEVNPLVLTEDEEVVILDCKMSVDDTAEFRQSSLFEMNSGDDSSREKIAKKQGFSYVHLEGDVGIIGNGAGLVMATMDAVKNAGGEPANFLDIGGGAKAEVVNNALKLVEGNPKVKSIFINVFGGITRGDEVARGIADVVNESSPRVPIVIRLTGTRAEEGLEILKNETDLSVTDVMDEAAELAVRLRDES